MSVSTSVDERLDEAGSAVEAVDGDGAVARAQDLVELVPACGLDTCRLTGHEVVRVGDLVDGRSHCLQSQQVRALQNQFRFLLDDRHLLLDLVEAKAERVVDEADGGLEFFGVRGCFTGGRVERRLGGGEGPVNQLV